MTDIEKSYLGNPNLKAANVKVEFTKDQVEEYLKCSKSIDPQEVVIDEVLGQWIAIAFIPFNFEAFLLAFILFRFFDIFKLFPINKIEKIKGFIGVIGDDLLAGIYTAIIITILSSYGFI